MRNKKVLIAFRVLCIVLGGVVGYCVLRWHGGDRALPVSLASQMPKRVTHLGLLRKVAPHWYDDTMFASTPLFAPNTACYAYKRRAGTDQIVCGKVSTGEEEIVAQKEGKCDWKNCLTWPQWSPDSRSIVYCEISDGQSMVKIYDTETKTVEDVTTVPDAIVESAMFWDQGTRLLLLQNVNLTGGRESLRWVFFDLATGQVAPVLRTERMVIQSPDRKRVLAFSDEHMFLLDQALSGEKEILSSVTRVTSDGAVWSPDSRYILAIFGRPSPSKLAQLPRILTLSDGWMYAYECYAYDVQTGEAVKLHLSDRIKEAFLLWHR